MTIYQRQKERFYKKLKRSYQKTGQLNQRQKRKIWRIAPHTRK